MYVEWTKHLQDEQEKEKFKQRILASKDVLDRIKDILEEKEAALDRTEVNIETYNLSGWDYRQAHKNGNRESLNFLRKLVDIDQQRR